jgi:hypothetical protein
VCALRARLDSRPPDGRTPFAYATFALAVSSWPRRRATPQTPDYDDEDDDDDDDENRWLD